MKREQGFSLVELIVVIVLIGAIGGIFAMQLGPTIRGYIAVGKRAGLTDQADTALRRIVTDVRAAVPNSLRLGSAQCLDLMPTIGGGRYRTGPDVDVAGDAFLDYDTPANQFDVLTTFRTVPVAGDLVVIGNQNPEDVHDPVKKMAVVDRVEAPPAATLGAHRIVLQAPVQIPAGYEGGRFVVVPGGQQVVSYVCTTKPTRGTNGTGTGTLHRIVRARSPAPACDIPPGSPVLASKVERCEFVFSPNQGATQQSGFVQLKLTITDSGESVSLTLGAHVSNVP
ncbi:type II secretion system protein [Telluria aromaticivorans]|uniref:Type II secretion system protein n=1 Tax=Telluria aromaticivorans TaxID=2725995 RepID=A0A7Y2K444_9BURK|nr:type II secretion system protein [Telluria aromaticivorans]NNG25705.1 type II secretion system protein [Telluria aromaticivorans]